MWVQSLDWEEPLEEEMATHSSIPAWEISWKEEPGRLQPTGSQRAGCNLATKQQQIPQDSNACVKGMGTVFARFSH